jgi:two-component system, chemotaxis family, sensor kinase CheA
MPKDPKITQQLEQLALQAIMAEADDLMTLGSILEKLGGLEKIEIPKELGQVKVLGEALKKLVEKIVLREISDSEKGLTLLRDGIRIMQGACTHRIGALPDPVEKAFWNEIEALAGIKASLPEKQTQSSNFRAEAISEITQDVEFYKDFVSEGLEHLNTIELKIINLEQSPEDKECLNAIFRPFHTIKGVSGFLNLKQINQFAHAMESLLDDARNQKFAIHQAIIDCILEAVDFLKGMILDLKSHLDSGQVIQSHFELAPFLEKIATLQKGETSPAGISPISEEGGGGDAPRPPLGEILSAKGIVSKDDVQGALEAQLASNGEAKIGEILVKENKVNPKQVIEALRAQKKMANQFSDTNVKVDTVKLDNLMDLVGELVIAQSLVQQNYVFSSALDQKLNRDFSQLKRITSDLQKTSMSLRMVPIRQTFQKMIRLVRDLAKKSGKIVELIMTGEETEIDRNMVDMLYDPLVHMIRNSIDHGIELPQKRKELGKPEAGIIYLRAFHKGGYIVIELEDDGQGLNRSKILKKARERGLISMENSLTDYQIDNLIFEPGFSTADQVTEISGRGVGMDVVKKNIEQLKGMVEIFSVTGKGCRFLVRIPLTLAIMDGIVICIGEERYVIPTVFIREVIRPQQDHLFTIHKKGEVIQVRENLLPLIRLYRLLGCIPRKKDPWEALVVVVETESCQKGLMVDDLIGKQEVVIKSLGENLKSVKGVAGATILGDGRVGLILDIHGIFEIEQSCN